MGTITKEEFIELVKSPKPDKLSILVVRVSGILNNNEFNELWKNLKVQIDKLDPKPFAIVINDQKETDVKWLEPSPLTTQLYEEIMTHIRKLPKED